MTTLVEDVQAVLNPLAAGGAWYMVNTMQPPTFPFIVWQRIVSTSNNTLDGPTDTQNTRIQIDIYSRSVAEAESIEAALEAVMKSAPFTNVPISSQDLYEPEVRAFRVMKDYSVWSTK